MLKPCPARSYYFSQFLAVAGLLAFAYYLEFYQGLTPCALCELQRLVFAVLGGGFLMGSVLPQRRCCQVVLNLLLSVMALFGLVLAARQVWLQYLPVAPNNGACEASLSYLLQVMSWRDALLNVFLGGPECAKVDWQFLHLSIAAWSLLCFAGFFVLALMQGLGWWCSRR